VTDLARQVGVSASLISQIERGRSQPSVASLFALSRALQVPVDYFFGDDEAESASAREIRRQTDGAPTDSSGPPQPGDNLGGAGNPVFANHADAREHARRWEGANEQRYVVPRDERVQLDIRGGVRWERLTPFSLGWIDFLELVYQPHAESDSQVYRHPGMEMVVILEGRLDIQVGFELHQLGPGDSIAFSSSIPHRYVNPTDQVSRAISTIIRDDSLPGDLDRT
jgi:DNA-binding XRE family transcriptional regulator